MNTPQVRFAEYGVSSDYILLAPSAGCGKWGIKVVFKSGLLVYDESAAFCSWVRTLSGFATFDY